MESRSFCVSNNKSGDRNGAIGCFGIIDCDLQHEYNPQSFWYSDFFYIVQNKLNRALPFRYSFSGEFCITTMATQRFAGIHRNIIEIDIIPKLKASNNPITDHLLQRILWFYYYK